MGADTFFRIFWRKIFFFLKNIFVYIFEAFPALWYQKNLVLNFLNIMNFILYKFQWYHYAGNRLLNNNGHSALGQWKYWGRFPRFFVVVRMISKFKNIKMLDFGTYRTYFFNPWEHRVTLEDCLGVFHERSRPSTHQGYKDFWMALYIIIFYLIPYWNPRVMGQLKNNFQEFYHHHN